jgi:hypothetical protein
VTSRVSPGEIQVSRLSPLVVSSGCEDQLTFGVGPLKFRYLLKDAAPYGSPRSSNPMSFPWLLPYKPFIHTKRGEHVGGRFSHLMGARPFGRGLKVGRDLADAFGLVVHRRRFFDIYEEWSNV